MYILSLRSLHFVSALLDIPDAVIGVTVSAAGTSLPNYVASKVAAEKGSGNMAVSNAFGSNTFNIMVSQICNMLEFTSLHFLTNFACRLHWASHGFFSLPSGITINHTTDFATTVSWNQFSFCPVFSSYSSLMFS